MSKSNLSFILGNSSSSKSSSSPRLSILQQPVYSKVTPRSHFNNCIMTPLSEHRPIHPPPILKLTFDEEQIPSLNDDGADASYENSKALSALSNNKALPRHVYYSTYFVTVDIVDEETDGATNVGSNSGNILRFEQDVLSGNKVSSGMHIKLPMKNETKKLKHFNYDYSICFLFGDISVKKLGKFKLKFKLYEFNNYKIQFKHSIESQIFTVFSQKKFPGAIPSTPLTKYLYKHGARIRQRKSKKDSKLEDTAATPTGTITKKPASAGNSLGSVQTTTVLGPMQNINIPINQLHPLHSHANPLHSLSKKRSFSVCNENFYKENIAKRNPTNNQYCYFTPQYSSPLPSPINQNYSGSSYSPPISPVFSYFGSANSNISSPANSQLISPVTTNFEKPANPPLSAPPESSNSNHSVFYREPQLLLNPPPKIRPLQFDHQKLEPAYKVRLPGISSIYKSEVSHDKEKIRLPSLTKLFN